MARQTEQIVFGLAVRPYVALSREEPPIQGGRNGGKESGTKWREAESDARWREENWEVACRSNDDDENERA